MPHILTNAEVSTDELTNTVQLEIEVLHQDGDASNSLRHSRTPLRIVNRQ